jgi:hemerythrin
LNQETHKQYGGGQNDLMRIKRSEPIVSNDEHICIQRSSGTTMHTIAWTPDLATGNAEIDHDHQELFVLLERLRLDARTGLVNQETQTIIDALRDYTENHFAREEAFMRAIRYPDYATHKAEHERFVSEICALQSRVARGARTLSLSIEHVLSDWLRRHVLVLDMALAKAVADSKNKAETAP